MSVEMIPVRIPCEFCGELHEEYAIDGHVAVPHLCEKCWKIVYEEWEKIPRCIECRHCTYIPEYEIYWCEINEWPMDTEFRFASCKTREKYEEE